MVVCVVGLGDCRRLVGSLSTSSGLGLAKTRILPRKEGSKSSTTSPSRDPFDLFILLLEFS